MKKILYILSFVCLGLASCDKIDGPDRIVDVPQSSNDSIVSGDGVERRMLIEDFTGQNCVNCPDVAELLTELKENVYKDKMILVAMHAGGFSDGTILHNETAQIYYDALVLKSNPAISIDRQYSNDGSSDNWPAYIASRAAVKSPCDIKSELIYDAETRNLRVVSDIDFYTDYTGKLGVQHYLVMDGIVAEQATHTGTDYAYVHNHVMRGVINDVWGMSLPGSLNADDASNYKYNKGEKYTIASNNYTVNSYWNVNNISIVSFVFQYSDNESNPIKEVLQTNIVKLVN